MAITKNSPEFDLWKEVYMLRNKYHEQKKTDEAFSNMLNECRTLNSKYENTDARIPAKWCTQMLLEMFNEEYMQRIGERKENDGRKSE